MRTKIDTPEIVLITAILTLTLTSLLYKVCHEPQGPQQAIIIQNGVVDVWTHEHMQMVDGVLYITDTNTIR